MDDETHGLFHSPSEHTALNFGSVWPGVMTSMIHGRLSNINQVLEI